MPSNETNFLAICYCCGEKHPVHHPDLPKETVYIAMYEGHDENGCRAIVICSACMEKGDFDMWTNGPEWDSKEPLVPYQSLPPYDHDDPDRDRVSKYPFPQELLRARVE